MIVKNTRSVISTGLVVSAGEMLLRLFLLSLISLHRVERIE